MASKTVGGGRLRTVALVKEDLRAWYEWPRARVLINCPSMRSHLLSITLFDAHMKLQRGQIGQFPRVQEQWQRSFSGSSKYMHTCFKGYQEKTKVF